MSDSQNTPLPHVEHGPEATDDWGSLEGAVPASELPPVVLRNLPPMPVVGAAAESMAAGDEAAPKVREIEGLPPIEVRGYYAPGPVPVLSRERPRLQVAFKLVLEAEHLTRLHFYEMINEQLQESLAEAIAEAGKLYVLVQKDMAWKERMVSMVERMHAVVADHKTGLSTEADDRDALRRLVSILAEDLPEQPL